MPVFTQNPNRWESEIRAFEESDRKRMPTSGGVVFVGSSSIRLWKTLDADFPRVPVLNRGFGGSFLADSVQYAPRIVLPYKPRSVILYAGDNDLSEGKSPRQVADDWQEFVRVVHTSLPNARIIYILIKPSILRLKLLPVIEEANRLIIRNTLSDRRLAYADIFTPMLQNGKPRPELFVADGLHLNAQGYALWRQVIAPFVW